MKLGAHFQLGAVVIATSSAWSRSARSLRPQSSKMTPQVRFTRAVLRLAVSGMVLPADLHAGQTSARPPKTASSKPFLAPTCSRTGHRHLSGSVTAVETRTYGELGSGEQARVHCRSRWGDWRGRARSLVAFRVGRAPPHPGGERGWQYRAPPHPGGERGWQYRAPWLHRG